MRKARASSPAISARRREQYVLRLYVAGLTPRSRQAIANITSICEEYLQGRYDLEVIDVFKRPVLAREEQIVATPTLVKKLPAPLRRLIGDLSEREKVLIGLDVRRQG
ncbi:MAG TPA: circadian clock protein KaiB [Myxococcales bacterium]|nr:circadian clock protein KaiB [Myxococcales bacterium]